MTEKTISLEVEPVVGTLMMEWAAIDALFSGLDSVEWTRPTALPGWTVRDALSHVVGTESHLAGEPEPPATLDVTALPHVRNEIGATNEHWVRHLRAVPPEAVLRRFREVTERRARSLRAMHPEEFDAPTLTPAGQATYRRFMEIRVYDCWMHEQDVRDAVGRPGHEDGRCAEASIDEIARALGFIVGKRAGAPDGSTVTIELTGPVHRLFHVEVDGRARVVTELMTAATATLSLSSSLFGRLTGGRIDATGHEDEIGMSGDLDLARRVALNLAFTI